MKFQITASTNEQLSDTYLCLIDNMAKKLQKPAAPKDPKLHYDELTNLYEKSTFERLVQERLQTDNTTEYGLV
ncbi:phosphodiesterase, partial [Erysipelatoclostridium ramosum]|uniref:hypothetical protein n=1 Tax=Thomasclavelia ramosa TaxID=1547 RepID=UPI003AB99B8F|nr:phosphodiesterase [Thomasclavelia ramosa]